MISDASLEKFAHRELLHLKDEQVDARLYDTGQIVVFGTETEDGPVRKVGTTKIIDEIKTPVCVTLDLRSENSSCYSGKRNGASNPGLAYEFECFNQALDLLKKNGADLNKWDKPGPTNLFGDRYHELSGFVSDLESTFVTNKWKKHPLAIGGFLPTLLGHGNMSPQALLHPKVMLSYVTGTIFPFERTAVFDFEKGRKNLETRENYIEPGKVLSHDGMAVLIRPNGLSESGRKDYQSIEAHFFNPVNYRKFLEDALTVERHIPSKEDWQFTVTYGIENKQKWLHFSAYPFNQSRRGLLLDGKPDIYLKANEGLVDTLEKIAPLHF